MANKLIALHEKNQRLLNQAYYADRLWHSIRNQKGSYDLWEYFELSENEMWDKAVELWRRLPEVEMINALKQYKQIHG